jgi:hypothetical protein
VETGASTLICLLVSARTIVTSNWLPHEGTWVHVIFIPESSESYYNTRPVFSKASKQAGVVSQRKKEKE